MAEASSVALGAIAMQGVRRSNPNLGEVFVVFGLGILGQITVQLLRNNGCTVIGIDIEDQKGQIAMNNGMNHFINGSNVDVADQVKRFSNGVGADSVIITAASSSNQIVSDAFKMSRKRGRVVLVGSVGLELKRPDFYKDEIDFLISTSYGPGRYDPNYEEKGIDYPIGYVRWTEKRNMQLYLDLIRTKKLKIKNLIDDIIDVENAHKAYEQFSNKEIHGMVHCSGGAQTKVLHFIENLKVIKDNLPPIPPLFQLIHEESGTSWKEMYQVFNMGHRYELYLPEEYAQAVIDISKSFNVDAQIVGRVEAADKKEVEIITEGGTYNYL